MAKPPMRFKPVNENEHEQVMRGAKKPDYCAHCGRPAKAHKNGMCPTGAGGDNESGESKADNERVEGEK